MTDDSSRPNDAVGRYLALLQEGLFETDRDFNIVFVNDFGARLAGFEDAKALLASGLHSFDLFVDPGEHRRLAEQVQKAGKVDGFICRMKNIHGQERVIELSSNLVLDKRGERVGQWGVLRDVSSRYEAEQARERLQLELERSNRDLKLFSAAVVHDLRTPLVSLKGFTEMLQDGTSGTLNEHGRHLVERIHFNARQMDLIIQGLQELLQLEPEREPRGNVDLGQTLATVLSNRQVEVGVLGVQVEVQQSLPPVNAHPSLLYQLLDNLVGNALRALQGRSAPRLVFGFGRPEHPRAFFLEDNGPGVPVAERRRIFELFYRVDHREPGAGIGLAVVRRIVQHYGGQVWVEEGRSGGARFCFEIPDPL